MRIFYTLMIVIEMFKKLYEQTDLAPSSKNKYTIKILWRLTEKYNKLFSRKCFTTSHGKGIVDGVGGNCTFIVRQKTLSKGKTLHHCSKYQRICWCILKICTAHESCVYRSINQWWENQFWNAYWMDCLSTRHYKSSHMIYCTSHSAKLWRNCGYKLDQLDITVHFNPRELGICKNSVYKWFTIKRLHYVHSKCYKSDSLG